LGWEGGALGGGRTPIELAVSWFLGGRIVVEISPMSLFVEKQFFAADANPSQWHHHVVTQY